jgi:hypothetical protein
MAQSNIDLDLDLVEHMLEFTTDAKVLAFATTTSQNWREAAGPVIVRRVRALLGAGFEPDQGETWLHALGFTQRQAAISRCKAALGHGLAVMAATTLGVVISFGGAGHLLIPKQAAAHHIVNVSAHGLQFAAVTQSGKLLMLGDPTDYQPLGALNEVGGALSGLHVVSVSVQDHYIAVVAQDKLFTFGSGADGQLGHGTETNELLPRRVLGALTGLRVLQVSTAVSYTTVVTDDGQLFNFGTCMTNSMGHGPDVHNAFSPRRVEGVLIEEHVVSAAAGLMHTVILTSSGAVFTFGFGVIGHADQSWLHWPQQVQALAACPVARIAAGHAHTVLLTRDGDVLTFGANQHGQLGRHGSVIEPEYLPCNVQLPALAAERSVAVLAGNNRSGVLTSTGRLVTFGIYDAEGGTVQELPE